MDPKDTVVLMYALLVILAALCVAKIPDLPQRKAPTYCPLHRVDRTKCAPQHREDDPAVPHEPPTLP